MSFNQFGDREPKGEIYSYECERLNQFYLLFFCLVGCLFVCLFVYFYTVSSDTVNYSINIAKFSPFAIVNENNSGLDFINGETRGSVFPCMYNNNNLCNNSLLP